MKLKLFRKTYIPGGLMQYLDYLLISSIDSEHLESVFNDRNKAVEKAYAENNLVALMSIAAIDKINIDFLNKKISETRHNLNNINKINDYLSVLS